MTFLAAGLLGARNLLLQFISKVLNVRINKCIVLFIYLLSVCFFMHMCLCIMCVPCAHRGKERALDAWNWSYA